MFVKFLWYIFYHFWYTITFQKFKYFSISPNLYFSNKFYIIISTPICFQYFLSIEKAGWIPEPTTPFFQGHLLKSEALSYQHHAKNINFRGSQVLNFPKGPSDKQGIRMVCQLRPQGPFVILEKLAASITADVRRALYTLRWRWRRREKGQRKKIKKKIQINESMVIQ